MSDVEDLLDAYERMLDNLPPATPRPCSECPWVRTAMPGHLGPYTAEQWCEIAHGETAIACHLTIRRTNDEGYGDWSNPEMRQCAGAAIFRANIMKSPRHPKVASADEPDESTVFSWDDEFLAHHTKNRGRHGGES